MLINPLCKNYSLDWFRSSRVLSLMHMIFSILYKEAIMCSNSNPIAMNKLKGRTDCFGLWFQWFVVGCSHHLEFVMVEYIMVGAHGRWSCVLRVSRKGKERKRPGFWTNFIPLGPISWWSCHHHIDVTDCIPRHMDLRGTSWSQTVEIGKIKNRTN